MYIYFKFQIVNAAKKTIGATIKRNRKIKVFLIFLVLATIIWLLIQLSKTYTSTTGFAVEYNNVPSNKLLQNKSITRITVVLKAPGFALLKYKLIPGKISFNLSTAVKKKNDLYYVLTNQQLTGLNARLSNEIEFIRILPDTIYVELGTNLKKKVPVKPNISLKFKPGYSLTKKLEIIPDSLVVTGPKKYIDTISSITTTNFELTEVFENINTEIDILNPYKKNGVTVTHKKVKIKGFVDRFTEGKMLIPVVVINQPEGVTIKPFPKEIEITYKAGLSNFNKINANSIGVVFDYMQYKNDTLLKHLTPVVNHKSEYISSFKINPTQIEFLIQK